MRNLLLLPFFCVVLVVAASGQSTQLEPVPGMAPVIMGPDAFENITYSASIDRFGALGEKDLKSHVDRYLSLISNNNKTVEYVVLLDSSSKEMAAKVKWFSDYLKSKKIAVNRYSFGFAQTMNGATELWLSPNKNVKTPMYLDAVIIGADDSEALDKFIKSR